MPKRNLDGTTKIQGRKDGKVGLQAWRLATKFEHGSTALSRALKTARGFERQKLGRREKTAKSESSAETLARLEEEIKILKTLDFQATAEKYLFKQLTKTKRIAESQAFINFKETQKISTEGPRSSAEANITARLFKSTPVRNVLPGIMEGFKKILELDDVPAGGKSERTAESKDSKTKSDKKTSSEVDDGKPISKPSAEPSEPKDSEGDIDLDDAESLDFAQFDDRLGSGSDDEDEAEEAASDDASDGGMDLSTSKPSNLSDISISRSSSPEYSDSPPSKKAKSSKSKSSAPATSTTFLPSLTMGGYFSGSESEPEDLEAAEPPRRKNRMGQQARRALWEKKYGSGANHVKQQEEKDRKNRDRGWDVRRGATGGGDAGRGKYGQGRGSVGGGRFRQQDNRSQYGPASTSKKVDDKPLHPSWEAARKAKEQKATASFQGKKVVFD